MSEFLSSPRTPRSQTILVAINGRKNSKYVIKWALDNFLSNENPVFKLLHVCVGITSVPTPMGCMPISQAREDEADAYRQEVQWKITEMLVLYKRMFLERKVQVDVLRIKGDDIAKSIANEVAKGRVDKLVIGASSRGGLFTRKVNGENFSSKITEIIPSFCTVYAVSKAKLLSVRESTADMSVRIKDDNSETSWNGKLSPVHQPPSEISGSIKDVNSVTISSEVSSLQTAVSAVSENSPRRDQGSATSYSHSSSEVSLEPSESEIFISSELEKLRIELLRTRGMYGVAQSETLEASPKLNEMTKSRLGEQGTPKERSFSEKEIRPYSRFFSSPELQRSQSLSTINQRRRLNAGADLIEMNPTESKGVSELPSSPKNLDTFYTPSRVSSLRKQLTRTNSWFSDQVSEAGSNSPSRNEVIMSLELEKLRIELQHSRGMYAIAQSEKLEASRKLKEMTKSRLGEPGTPKEISYKDEKAKKLVKQEDKYEDTKREANYVMDSAQRVASQGKEAETKSVYDASEKENPQDTNFGTMQQYKKFTWEEIVDATSSFSEKLIIGKGANGTVYKCELHCTTAAVKLLHSREGQSTKQFQQELEVLSRIRHPYLLLLLGACPEQGCLVYEYMENGSLEDRLLRRNNKTPPIPWFDRFRIAWEIASGLVFLHNSKPRQIIHRDLKPANILLDHNLGSKIGDVGLSKMVQSADAFAMSMYNQTTLVGTLSYIDPEYQRTGVNSPKSDVYAFGIVLLQLLTAKSTTALNTMVETAVDDDNLMKVLDPEAGHWPLEEAKELAILGLSCAELRRRDRPDLKGHVLPTLERLRAAADKARNAVNNNNISEPPGHFICPLLKEVMNDPCVASDGYTYDRKSIETWLEANDKSPMTNVTLPTKNLITNYTLLSAILEWKSEQS